jgi:hypothetical protein
MIVINWARHKESTKNTITLVYDRDEPNSGFINAHNVFSPFQFLPELALPIQLGTVCQLFRC